MSLNQALSQVQARNYVIASIDKEGLFSMSSRPMFHGTLDAAITECGRLAQAGSGKAYVVCQLRGGAILPTSLQVF